MFSNKIYSSFIILSAQTFRHSFWLFALLFLCSSFAASAQTDDEQTRQIIPVFEKARQKNAAGKQKFSSNKSRKARLRVARRQNSDLKSSVARINEKPKKAVVSKQNTSLKKNPAKSKKSAPNDFSLDKAQKIGLTLWKMETAKKDLPANEKTDNPRSIVHPVDGYVPARVSSETYFRAGEKIRLSVESPNEGYLYVLNCEVFADGEIGQPTLIFPTRQIRGGQNFLTAGSPIEIPAVTDRPSYFELRPNLKPKKVVAEALVFIITNEPIKNRQIPDQPEIVDEEELRTWEQKWTGKTEVWELEGESGKFYTQGEYESALEIRTRGLGSNGNALDVDEPEPQTIYAVESPAKDGMMFTLLLRYL